MRLLGACLLALAWAALLSPPTCGAANILFMGPFPAPSHWMWLEHFVRELLQRGHQVTTLTNHPAKLPHPNLTEIIIRPSFNIPKHYPKETIFNMRFSSDFQNLQMWWQIGLLTSEHALNDQKVKALIADRSQQFDLVILEQFFHESFLMFGALFNCPIVTIGTMGYADNMDHNMGLLTPWSFIPHLLLSYTDHMTFKQRAYNAYLSLYDNILRRWHYLPRMQDMAERHFGRAIQGRLPSVFDLQRNISLILVNAHRSTDLPRPSMPGLVNVGGVHIKPAKALPPDLKKYLDKAQNGVVYFSLGSYMKSTDMPAEKVQLLLRAFNRLKQNVLWKYENETLGHLPPNVMIRKWMPQNDILAHPNVKLFITHGGVFGTQEAIHWGVPMLCMPLYGDQHRNSIKSVRGGYARSLVFSEMTAEEIVRNVEKMIKEPSYKQHTMEISRKFRDNLVPPMEEAIFWIEYVIRHKGAPHLKSYGTFMSLPQYLMLDVLGCVVLVVILLIWLPWKLITLLRRPSRPAQPAAAPDPDKKQN